MRLTNVSKNGAEIATNVKFASTFFARAFGLMGKKELPAGEALFFKGSRSMPCNSIQTTFMRFPLDVVFLDPEMKVKSILRGLKPWRVTWPVNGAVTAIEMTSGSLNGKSIEVGDQLHVGD
jgi:uncharacterized membrane protein (UPF0127 family)